MKKSILGILLVLTACTGRNDTPLIAVFVPGVLEGSPTYEMMDTGVRQAAKDTGTEVLTIEGGYDQSQWEPQLTALAAEKTYGLIVTSNPAMSEICSRIWTQFPDQQFLVLDGSAPDDQNVTNVVYDHREQAFLAGYFAGLMTDAAENSGSALTAGLIAGQEYPQMMNEIVPGYEIGLHTVNPDIELEFRVVGNWYDAAKAQELAASLYRGGAEIILAIAGGAGQGVISAAKESDAYVLWFDSDGSGYARGTVVGSAVIDQERAAREWTASWIDGEIKPSRKIGTADGYIGFPHETRNLPKLVSSEMNAIQEQLKSGSVDFSVLDN